MMVVRLYTMYGALPSNIYKEVSTSVVPLSYISHIRPIPIAVFISTSNDKSIHRFFLLFSLLILLFPLLRYAECHALIDAPESEAPTDKIDDEEED